MTVTLEAPIAGPKRDRYGRPVLTPRAGGKAKPYTRPTTIADTLDDRFNLELWKQRQVLLGAVARHDLYAKAATTDPTDKKALNKLCEQLLDAAASDSGANTGTAVHAAVEAWARGETFHDMFAHDVEVVGDAIAAAGFTVDPDHVEQFVVNEVVGAAGTYDMRLVGHGSAFVGDLKTGSTVEWSAKAFSIQLCIYAAADSLYDWATETHHDVAPVDADRGVIVHHPAGSDECTLHWIDLAAGREALEHALWVRRWRNWKDLLTEIEPGGPSTVSEGSETGTVERPDRGSRPARITATTTVTAPDEGGEAGADDIAAMTAEAPPKGPALDLVLRWRKDAKGVHRWHTNDGYRTVRRVAITRTAFALARFVVDCGTDTPDDTARTALEEVLGDSVQTFPVGELLGALTFDECRAMRDALKV